MIETLKEAIENPERMDADSIEILTIETDRYFADLQSTLASGDPEAIEKAVQEALEIKQLLKNINN